MREAPQGGSGNGIDVVRPGESSAPRLSGDLFPFSAIVGQEQMKLALLLNGVNPLVGGVLIRGEKGTAKSTTVRAMARLLVRAEYLARASGGRCDSQQDLATDESAAMRMVELPLNATEEMLVGGLDFSASLREGRRVFQPGLLAKAHRGILYVDEVNLLPDHLADMILDAAASGENLVQREGISFRHPCRFVLVGTMNPEEGELRPQLLDRFGLCVNVDGERDAARRVEVLKQRDEFDRDPGGFVARFRDAELELARALARSRGLLRRTVFPKRLYDLIARMCLEMNVAGHRADMVLAQAARALAALEGRVDVLSDDVDRVRELALCHRARKRVTDGEAQETGAAATPRVRRRPWDDEEDYPRRPPQRVPVEEVQGPQVEFGPSKRRVDLHEHPEAIFDVGEIFKPRGITHRADRRVRNSSGKRTRSRSQQRRGRYVTSTSLRRFNDVALDATLRAAAPHQSKRRAAEGLLVAIRDEDIREKIRENRSGDFLLFIVDASGSMGAKGRMLASKGAIMSLLRDAYHKRDRVAMVSFRRQEAVVNLPPTSSIYRAARLLKLLPVGGRTPLAAGLRRGQALVRNVLIKDPDCRPIAIIMTDGKANESMGRGDPFWEAIAVAKSMASEKRLKSVVVDAEEFGEFRYGFAARLAEILKGEYLRIGDLRSDVLRDIVRSSS